MRHDLQTLRLDTFVSGKKDILYILHGCFFLYRTRLQEQLKEALSAICITPRNDKIRVVMICVIHF